MDLRRKSLYTMLKLLTAQANELGYNIAEIIEVCDYAVKLYGEAFYVQNPFEWRFVYVEKMKQTLKCVYLVRQDTINGISNNNMNLDMIDMTIKWLKYRIKDINERK